jgi:hypothetical protein
MSSQQDKTEDCSIGFFVDLTSLTERQTMATLCSNLLADSDKLDFTPVPPRELMSLKTEAT